MGPITCFDQTGTQYIDCSDVELPFGGLYLADVTNRTQTAISQEHVFLASELALRAEQMAFNITPEFGKK